MITLVELIVLALATARLTRLTTRDNITEPLRTRAHEWVMFDSRQRRARAAGDELPPALSPVRTAVRMWVMKLIRCDWCVGFWWAAAVVVVFAIAGDAAGVQIAIGALAVAHLVGLVAEWETPANGHEH